MGAYLDWNEYRGESSKPFQEIACNGIHASNQGYVAAILSVCVMSETMEILVDDLVTEMLHMRNQSD